MPKQDISLNLPEGVILTQAMVDKLQAVMDVEPPNAHLEVEALDQPSQSKRTIEYLKLALNNANDEYEASIQSVSKLFNDATEFIVGMEKFKAVIEKKVGINSVTATFLGSIQSYKSTIVGTMTEMKERRTLVLENLKGSSLLLKQILTLKKAAVLAGRHEGLALAVMRESKHDGDLTGPAIKVREALNSEGLLSADVAKEIGVLITAEAEKQLVAPEKRALKP